MSRFNRRPPLCAVMFLSPHGQLIGPCTRVAGHDGRCQWSPRRDPTHPAYKGWAPSD